MITEEQRERTAKEMRILDDSYIILEKYHKLYKEGKTNTPEYKELEIKLERLFPIKREDRKKSKSLKPRRCKCK